jgi:hypothetical protein
MKKIFRYSILLPAAILTLSLSTRAQEETYDLVSYVAPNGWKKEIKETLVSHTITNKKTGSWCQVNIIKSTISKGNIDLDFASEWQELIVTNYKPADSPRLQDVKDLEGWKIKTGNATFLFNNANCSALLTTASGYQRCVSIVIITNSQDYAKDIETMLASAKLIKPEANPPAEQIKSEPAKTVADNKFAFTTTNFDNGWISTEQEDWVRVVKGNLRVLIHYPNQNADVYNSDLLEGLKNAWKLLVEPRYQMPAAVEFKPILNWQSIEFAETMAQEKATGKTVHVVLFKFNASGGNNRYLEFISPDKNAFEQEFGAYHQTSSGWEKMQGMANYNKFAVAATDLQGKWTSNFSSSIQYVNAYTGNNAGIDTHASNENFYITAENSYKWDLAVASGMVGNIRFQTVKSAGKFSMPNNWQISFSDIEGKPRTYEVFFSCIKGSRILLLDGKAFARVE